MGGKLDLKGHVYTKLTVLMESSDKIKNEVTWVCQCECGKIVRKTTRQLRTRNNKSCGCLWSENARKIGLRNRKQPGENGLTSLYNSYRLNARRKGIDFNLDKDEFGFITKLPCFYCNKPPSQYKTPTSKTKEGEVYGRYLYNGIDRVDSKKGYFGGNVLPCCKDCNYAKGSDNVVNFINKINSIYKNFSGRFGNVAN